MGMTERECEEFRKENKKTGTQRFSEDYWAICLLGAVTQMVIALILSFIHSL